MPPCTGKFTPWTENDGALPVAGVAKRSAEEDNPSKLKTKPPPLPSLYRNQPATNELGFSNVAASRWCAAYEIMRSPLRRCTVDGASGEVDDGASGRSKFSVTTRMP